MSDLTRHLQIRASGFNGVAQTLENYQKLTRVYLERLRLIDERFSRVSILGRKGYEPVEVDLLDLDEKIIETIENKLRVEDKQKGLARSSLSSSGFSVAFFSYNNDVSRSHLILEEGGFELLIRGVSSNAEASGGITLTLPREPGEDEKLLEKAKRLIGATLEVWPFRFASARTLEFESTIALQGDLHSGQWITFLPFDDMGCCLPHGVEWENFHNGTLVTTTQSIPNPADPYDLAAGKRVREALDHLGLVWHSTYAIHGWPPDEEEWRYEQFISGAPQGRKYRVRCIDFDGYDAQRNVLLYAKLFRRLRHQRKEWGLRGWDGPVLNEARRQVRAANGTQIEWHVGLEEPAARVRTLLADYTDFKDEQLRVIYTPLSQASAR